MTKQGSSMAPAQLIALLNALNVGDLGAIATKLAEARAQCLEMQQTDLAAKIEDAAAALRAGNTREYRRKIETVVSRLGHLK